MIHSLRRRFIVIASLAVLTVITLVLISLNGITFYSAYHDINSILQFIVDNNGRMPVEKPSKSEVGFHVTPEIAYETRYFSFILPSDGGEIIRTDYEHISAVEETDIGAFFEEFINDRDGRGSFETDDGIYFYRSKTVSGESLIETYSSIRNAGFDAEEELDADAEYRIAVFMDCTDRIYRIQLMGVFSVLAGIICFVIFILILLALSKRAIKPAAESYEKQKQFITNAGHELKTPLAIISANAEVLEAIEGKNEWTESIVNQVKRLTGLVNDLITLARLEENAAGEKMTLESIDLSAKAKEVAESFVPVAERQGKTVDTQIDNGIKINCSEKSIHELMSILLDNAVKYCDYGGSITARLYAKKKQAVFEVGNAYKDGENTDYSRFFDRFYRGDASHNREKASGYGIGLSMAEKITELHKGKISASYRGGMIYFTVTLPRGGRAAATDEAAAAPDTE